MRHVQSMFHTRMLPLEALYRWAFFYKTTEVDGEPHLIEIEIQLYFSQSDHRVKALALCANENATRGQWFGRELNYGHFSNQLV